MKKPEINADAYRLVAESLFRIRQLLREGLRAVHGEEWEKGIPEERHGYLKQRRAREASINWHLIDTSDVLDYGGFLDLYEVIEANPQLQELFGSLANDVNVLRIRFMELDTILSRIAYVRQVADTELSFLISFDERLRKLIAGPRPAPASTAGKAAKPTEPPARAGHKPEPPSTASATSPASAPPREKKAEPAGRKPVAEAPVTAPEPVPVAVPTDDTPPPGNVTQALADQKDGAVLAALYGEITAIADGLWNQSTPPYPAIWEKVRESEWYHKRFASLGLKSVSDFYGLVDEARNRLSGGATKTELQDLLKERNFAQILLALRELFRHQTQVTN